MGSTTFTSPGLLTGLTLLTIAVFVINYWDNRRTRERLALCQLWFEGGTLTTQELLTALLGANATEECHALFGGLKPADVYEIMLRLEERGRVRQISTEYGPVRWRFVPKTAHLRAV